LPAFRGRERVLGAFQSNQKRQSNAVPAAPEPAVAIARLRAATRAQHARLDAGLDAVARFSDPERRHGLCARYAAFHIPADGALAPWLSEMPGLELANRSRAPLLARFAEAQPLPAFPTPVSEAEALGMLYVLEGSTLGGRFIAGALAARGIVDPDLAFLDPYGKDNGARWRAFLAVLVREIGSNERLIEDAGRGAVRTFDHAERILCGERA
jgi:heme oxygenase